MSKFTDKGYFVKESGPVYYTKDMDKTVKWFEEVLGWYSGVIDRKEDGTGVYGFASDIPQEIASSPVLPFQGIHLWYGAPSDKTVALIQVRGIDALYKYVKKNGWNKMSDIQKPGWSLGTCDITTPDGCVLTFFE